MQSNIITIGAVAYDRFKEYPDSSVYVAPDHSIGLNHQLALSRVVPTTEGSVARVRTKAMRNIVNPITNEKGAIYVTVEISQPTWANHGDVSAEALVVSQFMQLPEFSELLQKQSI